MTAEQQNIAIAEACGWVDCEFHKPEPSDYTEPQPKPFARGRKRPKDLWQEIPNYVADLNAMHEVARTLDAPHRALFECLLVEIVTKKEFNMSTQPISTMHYVDALSAIHATAAQRAETFLKTIGKWKE